MRRASSLVRGLLSGSVIARAMTSSSVKASRPCTSMGSFALVRAGFAPGPDGGRRALEVLAEVVVLLTACRLPCRDNADALIAFGVGYRQCPPAGPADDDETILSVVLTVVYPINAGGIVEHESRRLEGHAVLLQIAACLGVAPIEPPVMHVIRKLRSYSRVAPLLR